MKSLTSKTKFPKKGADYLTENQQKYTENVATDIAGGRVYSESEARAKIQDYLKRRPEMEVVWPEETLENYFEVINFLLDK